MTQRILLPLTLLASLLLPAAAQAATPKVDSAAVYIQHHIVNCGNGGLREKDYSVNIHARAQGTLSALSYIGQTGTAHAMKNSGGSLWTFKVSLPLDTKCAAKNSKEWHALTYLLGRPTEVTTETRTFAITSGATKHNQKVATRFSVDFSKN